MAEASGRAVLWADLQGLCPISFGETVFLGDYSLFCRQEAPPCSLLTLSCRTLRHLPAPRGCWLEL